MAISSKSIGFPLKNRRGRKNHTRGKRSANEEGLQCVALKQPRARCLGFVLFFRLCAFSFFSSYSFFSPVGSRGIRFNWMSLLRWALLSRSGWVLFSSLSLSLVPLELTSYLWVANVAHVLSSFLSSTRFASIYAPERRSRADSNPLYIYCNRLKDRERKKESRRTFHVYMRVARNELLLVSLRQLALFIIQ